MTVTVRPHDPNWARMFEREAERVRSALGDTVVAIHHIGSTSITGMYAKPIIDMLAEVYSLAAVDARAALLSANGYEAMGEFGIPGRRYFRKDNAQGIREYHVHTFATGSADITRHLAFRDYLRAHPSVAEDYSRLKRKLAEEFPSDADGYVDGKDDFIKAAQRAALAWWRPA